MLLRLFLVSVFTVELSPCGKKIPNLFQVAIPVAALLLQLVLIRILCAETGNESGESFPVTRIFNPFFVVDILHEFIFKGEKIIIVEVFECVLARESFIGVSTYIACCFKEAIRIRLYIGKGVRICQSRHITER